MNKFYKIRKLDLDSVYKIQLFYNEKNIQLKYSIISLFQWKSYNFEVFYYFNEIEYFFFIKNKITSNYDGLVVLLNENLSLEYFQEFIKILLEINSFFSIFSHQLEEKIIKNFNLKISKNFEPRISNYFYRTEKFKGFPGKVMQKKRNHFNYFLKNFLNHKIEKISEKNLNIAKDFVEKNVSNNEFEWNSYSHLFNNFSIFKNWIRGSILYVDTKVIGVTIGVINNDVYEILIEKALKNFRGSFQFLLSENLKINNINLKYVDRQDDLLAPNLIKSKESYVPDEKLVLICYTN